MIQKLILYFSDPFTFITTLINGVICSAFFLTILSFIKPRLKVSDAIASSPNLLSFKIINKSLFFKIYDIKVHLYKMKTCQSTNGEDEQFEVVQLRKDNLNYMASFCFYHSFQDIIMGDKRLKEKTNYAAQFSTIEPVSSWINNSDQFLRLEIFAKHPLTGFGRLFVKDYKHTNNIKHGGFRSGNSFFIS